MRLGKPAAIAVSLLVTGGLLFGGGVYGALRIKTLAPSMSANAVSLAGARQELARDAKEPRTEPQETVIVLPEQRIVVPRPTRPAPSDPGVSSDRGRSPISAGGAPLASPKSPSDGSHRSTGRPALDPFHDPRSICERRPLDMGTVGGSVVFCHL
jgi:hypothetical protein